MNEQKKRIPIRKGSPKSACNRCTKRLEWIEEVFDVELDDDNYLVFCMDCYHSYLDDEIANEG